MTGEQEVRGRPNAPHYGRTVGPLLSNGTRRWVCDDDCPSPEHVRIEESWSTSEQLSSNGSPTDSPSTSPCTSTTGAATPAESDDPTPTRPSTTTSTSTPTGGSGSSVERLRHILRGIDEYQPWSDQGWWETSGGADFGADKLAEVESLIAEIERRLEDAVLALWAELPVEQVRLLREEAPRLVEFIVHLHHAVEHEQAMVRTNVWAEA